MAQPVGDPGAREYLVIEMHYDNPQLHSGITSKLKILGINIGIVQKARGQV